MIRPLGQGGEHPHGNAGIARGVAADLLEERLRDVVRAGERREDPTRLEEPEAPEVDLLVASRCRLDGLLAPRERRRVEDDEPEPLLRRLEPAERVEGIVRGKARPGR